MATANPPNAPAAVNNRLDTNPPVLTGSNRSCGGNAGDLQALLNQVGTPGVLMPGDTIVCPAGAVYSPIVLPNRSDSNWIKITTSQESSLPAMQRVPASGAHMFQVLGGSIGADAPCIDCPTTTQGWWIVGAECTYSNTLEQVQGAIRINCPRVIVDRCYIHGFSPSVLGQGKGWLRGILARDGAVDTQVWNSWISEWQSCSDDAQAIWFSNMARGHVENCELQATGENIMFGDQNSDGPCLDMTLRRNHFFKPLRWRRLLADGTQNPSWDGIVGAPNSLWPNGAPWFIKELFEIKWVRRALIIGNIMENNWGGNQGQDGTACLTSASNHTQSPPAVNDLDTQDVEFRSNTIINAPQMFGVQTYQGTQSGALNGPFVTRVKYANNLGVGISNQLIGLHHQHVDIWVEHNTCVPGDGVDALAGARDAIVWEDPPTWTNETIRANVMGPSAFALFYAGLSVSQNMTTALADSLVPTRDWETNAVYNKSGQPACAGFTFFGDAAGVTLSSDPAVAGRLASTSPLKGTAFDGQDLGVNFPNLLADQAGTTPPPSATFTFLQQGSSLTVAFTDTSP